MKDIIKKIGKVAAKEIKFGVQDICDAVWSDTYREWQGTEINLGYIILELFGRKRKIDVILHTLFGIDAQDPFWIDANHVEALERAADNLDKTKEIEKAVLECYKYWFFEAVGEGWDKKNACFGDFHFLELYKNMHNNELFEGKITDENMIDEFNRAKITIVLRAIEPEVGLSIEPRGDIKEVLRDSFHADAYSGYDRIGLLVKLSPEIGKTDDTIAGWEQYH